MNKRCKYIQRLLITTGIATIVCIGWQVLELIIQGQIISNKVDCVIALVLTFSLYGNYKVWIDRS